MGWDNKTSKSSFMPNVYKNEQKIRPLALRQILFTYTAALQQERLTRTKRNVIVSAISQQQKALRPTRRTKTLGMSEDFDILLSRTAYSFFQVPQQCFTCISEWEALHRRSLEVKWGKGKMRKSHLKASDPWETVLLNWHLLKMFVTFIKFIFLYF